MKLVFLYGPPAVGKLTVARELAKLTGYKLLHNHLAGDLVGSIFDFNSKPFKNYSIKIRLDLLEAAAKENILGIIFTFMYSNPEGDKFVKDIIKKVKKYNGDVYFVQLFCDENELKKRVGTESRKEYNKVREIKILKKRLNEWNLYHPIPFVENLKIDNTKLTPKKVAQKIKDYYKL